MTGLDPTQLWIVNSVLLAIVEWMDDIEFETETGATMGTKQSIRRIILI